MSEPITDMNDVDKVVKGLKRYSGDAGESAYLMAEACRVIAWLKEQIIETRKEAYKPLKDYGSYL